MWEVFVSNLTVPLLQQDYADKYTAARDAYIDAAEALKLATGPYKASRDAYVAASKSIDACTITKGSQACFAAPDRTVPSRTR